MLQLSQKQPATTVSTQPSAATRVTVAAGVKPVASARRRGVNRRRKAERNGLWTAVVATLLGVVCNVRFGGSGADVKARHGMILPPSAVVMAQWGYPFVDVGGTGNRYTVLRLDQRDASALAAQIDRKLYRNSAFMANCFGFPIKAWRDGPNGSRAYLCKYKTSDFVAVTVEPERAGAVIVDLTTIITTTIITE